MIARSKNYSRPKPANLHRSDQPFYGLKSYRADSNNVTHAVKKKTPSPIKIPRIAPWKMILATITLGIIGFFYLTHVFATQEVLKEVSELRRAHETAKRSHAEHALTYDRMTGPASIYQKATTLGFIHGGAADPLIRIKK